jgi:hypothetical protein
MVDFTEELSFKEKEAAVGKCAYALLTIFVTAGWICGMYASGHCNFVERVIKFEDGVTLDSFCDSLEASEYDIRLCQTVLRNHGVGFYSWYAKIPVDEHVCISYTLQTDEGWISPDFDTKFNSAAALAITANVLGAFTWFTLMFSSCCPVSQNRLKGMSFYMFLACLFQGLTLLIFRSDVCDKGFLLSYFPNASEGVKDSIAEVSCELGTGSKLAIAATVFYFVCNKLAFIAVAPPPVGMRGYQAAMTGEEAPADTTAAEEKA